MQNPTQRHRDTALAELLADDRSFIEIVMAEMPPIALSWARKLPPDKGAKVVVRAIRRTDGIYPAPHLGAYGNEELRLLCAAEAALAGIDVGLQGALLVIRSAAPSALSAALDAISGGGDVMEVAARFFDAVSLRRGGYFNRGDTPIGYLAYSLIQLAKGGTVGVEWRANDAV